MAKKKNMSGSNFFIGYLICIMFIAAGAILIDMNSNRTFDIVGQIGIFLGSFMAGIIMGRNMGGS